jgi:osmotically-inducible protein OsmY
MAVMFMFHESAFGPPAVFCWDQGRIQNREIKQDVESELYWSPYVDSDNVTVTVEGGVVTLRGKVDTWYERWAAVENAFEGGAKDVFDKLEFTYGPAS